MIEETTEMQVSSEETMKSGPVEDFSIETLLRDTEALQEEPQLALVAQGIFHYAQFLLDDDENLTKSGNLSGAAKEKLRERTLELLGLGDADEDPFAGLDLDGETVEREGAAE